MSVPRRINYERVLRRLEPAGRRKPSREELAKQIGERFRRMRDAEGAVDAPVGAQLAFAFEEEAHGNRLGGCG